MSRWLRQLGAIYGKELVEGLRDRRSLLTALLFPLMGPLSVGAVIAQVADRVSRPEAVEVAVAGAENAPELMRFLEENGVKVREAPPDAERAVREGEVTVVVRVPADFADRLAETRPAVVEVIQDSSRPEGSGDVRRVRGLLQGWSGQIGNLRLLARGVSPEVVDAVTVDDVDTATPEKQASAFLELVDMMILLSAFFCNMYVAIDTTAGERERRSMEALLMNPVPRTVVVLAKWLATASFGAAGVGITVLATGAALALSPLEDIGARVDTSLGMGVVVFATTIPLLLFAAAFQVMLCSFSRSFKEAQTWVSLSSLVGTLPGMILTFQPFARAPWMMAVPVLAQQLLTGALARGERVRLLEQALAAGGTLLAAGVCVAVTVALFRRETITSR